MRRLMLTALACLALAACKDEAAADPLELLGMGVEWHVTEIAGAPVPAGVGVTIARPEDGMIAGSSGCNRYSGRVSTHDGKLEIGALAGTRMACFGPAEEVERAFHSTIGRAKDAQMAGDTLELTDAAGKVLIRAMK